ncbi:MAG: hypothetical protein AAF550_06010 [Myxococcota bacterium]
MTFRGSIRVFFSAADNRGTVSGTLENVTLDFTPTTSGRLSRALGRTQQAREISDFLGVTMMDHPTGMGLIIAEQNPNGRAANSGTAVGDTIVSIDRVKVRSFSDFVAVPGKEFAILEIRAPDAPATMELSVPLPGYSAEKQERSKTIRHGLVGAVLFLLFCFLPTGPLWQLPKRSALSSASIRSNTSASRKTTRGWSASLHQLGIMISILGFLIFYFLALPYSGYILAGGLDGGLILISSIVMRAGQKIFLPESTESRSACRRILSVTVPLLPVLALLVVLLAFEGTLDLDSIVRGQDIYPWTWFAFSNPLALALIPAFFVQIILSLASLKGLTGSRHSFCTSIELFYLASLVATLVAFCFGGWAVPMEPGNGTLLAAFFFAAKCCGLLVIALWIVCRFRVDALAEGWKWWVPLSLTVISGSTVWLLIGVPHSLFASVGPLLFGSLSLASIVSLGAYIRGLHGRWQFPLHL